MANRIGRSQSIASALMMLLLALACGCRRVADPPPERAVVRVAVIGGMTMSGLWEEIARRFEAATGYAVEVVATGPRPVLVEAMRAGRVDLLTMHSGDITTDLVADGYAVNIRPWARNEAVIVGPVSDPAGIRGMTNGAAALSRIAAVQANYVDFRGIGSREVSHALWRTAGIEPKAAWVLRDESTTKWNILQFCRSNEAYVVVGYLAQWSGRMPAEGMEVLVRGDPAMRRPYVVLEADPRRFPAANHAGARALSDFLVSAQTQFWLPTFQAGEEGQAFPLFYPVIVAPPASHESRGQDPVHDRY